MITVDTSPVVAKLKKLEQVDFAPFFAGVAEDLVNAVDAAFESSGASNGAAWQALAPSTLKYKARKGKGAKPLIFNGTWQGAPTVESGSDFAFVGTNVAYSVYHVSDGPRTKIPLRNPYDLQPAFFDDVFAGLGQYIKEHHQ